MAASERDVRIYRTPDRREPFLFWLTGLRDERARQKIQARVGRLRLGNFGQTRSLGGGIHELKIDYGPGYRVYFAHDGLRVVILLCGGDKTTQQADIRNSKVYWLQYQQEKKHADR
jgi:putative addiction module killer protein